MPEGVHGGEGMGAGVNNGSSRAGLRRFQGRKSAPIKVKDRRAREYRSRRQSRSLQSKTE